MYGDIIKEIKLDRQYRGWPDETKAQIIEDTDDNHLLLITYNKEFSFRFAIDWLENSERPTVEWLALICAHMIHEAYNAGQKIVHEDVNVKLSGLKDLLTMKL